MLPQKSPTILLLLLLTSPFHTQATTFQQWRTLISLSHSLMSRVSHLRASRGDYEGSQRAKQIANNLQGGGLHLWKGIWSVGWDYIRNYSWKDMSVTEMYTAVSDVNRILSFLNELTQLKTAKERTSWIVRNYKNVYANSKSLFQNLLRVFFRSGPLRDLVLTLQREAERGDLVKDCMEIGSNDLTGLVKIFKDLAVQFSGVRNNGRGEL
ncbi:hypothetical protein ACHQM5_004667 [Ranunculus cassubicifolius]